MEREALQMCLEYIETDAHERKHVRHAIKAALAQPWPDLTKRDRESYQKGHNDGVAHHKQAVKTAQPVQEPYGYDWSMLEAAQESLREHMALIHELEAALAQPAPPREWVGLTDEEINALLPEADGAAEVDVKRVEVQPGLWGEECSLADAWSLPLMLQFLNAYEAKLKEKNT